MKNPYSLTVRGKHKTWSHLVWANPEHVTDWREDGIEVDEVLYIVPDLVQSMGLTRPWCFLQRIGLIPMG
jgi:hypothetical protein